MLSAIMADIGGSEPSVAGLRRHLGKRPGEIDTSITVPTSHPQVPEIVIPVRGRIQ